MDWLKIDHSTPEKPELFRLAHLLKIPIEQVLGHLLRVWIWVDQQAGAHGARNVDARVDAAVDARVDGGVDADVDAVVDGDALHVDAVARISGFASAMCAVNWLVINAEKSLLIFPNLKDYISESAKNRALSSRRQRRWRHNANVTPRREKNRYSPQPPAHRARKKPTANSKGNGQGQVKGNGLRSDDSIRALGMKYELLPHPGESPDAYRERVMAEDRKRHDE